MNKYVLSLLFLLAAASVWGQSKSKVNLVSSTTMEAAPGANGNRIIKVHNGVFKQDYSTLTSDSAYFYPDLNMVDAFSHVVINQGDTVHIYADKLNYNGNTKTAILTDHVIMVDKDATLTTDHFNYNTATRIGTYTEGGKLVNKGNTLVSRNGYYFAFTRDAYFRYDVVCTTTDAVIKTDTMRYNANSRITYFYGPTIITGKDKDNLYTEDGTYSTVTEQARFGKKNLYTQKTKSLKGDSLFYDRLKGYGRAVKHVTFTDTEQRIILKGDLGEYFKINEEAVVTQNAYMIFITVDSTAAKADDKKQADSLSKVKKAIDSLAKKASPVLSKTSLPVDKKAIVKAATDSATKRLPVIERKLTLKGITDSVTKKLPSGTTNKLLAQAKTTDLKALPSTAASKPTATGRPVTQTKPPATVWPGNPPNALVKSAATAAVKGLPVQKIAKDLPNLKPIPVFTSVYKYQDTLHDAVDKPAPNVKYDSLFFVADTLRTRIVTYKDLKILKQKQYDLSHPDTTIKAVKVLPSIVYKKPLKYIELEPLGIPRDTSYMHRANFGLPKQPARKPVIKVVNAPAPKKVSLQDSLKAKALADSLALYGPKPLSDTARIRIVSGYNHAKLFKSDLQAKADSMFYATSDSTIRMYTNPMIWTQASQLSGDTITLQMKNRKLDNLDMYPAAFIVNLEKNDSTHYNQAGGKRMHGTFKNSKLDRFVIIGNAETIFFKRDSLTNIVTDMSRTVSGKAYANFDNGEVVNNAFAEKYEARGLPIGKVKEEEKILKGFIWKPKERPLSKESILSGYYKKPAAVVKPAGKPTTGSKAAKPGAKKPAAGKAPNAKASTDSTATTRPELKMGRDSLARDTSAIKVGRDTLRKDTSASKKAAKDTSAARRSVIIKN